MTLDQPDADYIVKQAEARAFKMFSELPRFQPSRKS